MVRVAFGLAETLTANYLGLKTTENLFVLSVSGFFNTLRSEIFLSREKVLCNSRNENMKKTLKFHCD
jgi:hypothetical protein